MVWDDKTALASFTNKIGVIIEDQDIASSIQTLWQMAWDNN